MSESTTSNADRKRFGLYMIDLAREERQAIIAYASWSDSLTLSNRLHACLAIGRWLALIDSIYSQMALDITVDEQNTLAASSREASLKAMSVLTVNN